MRIEGFTPFSWTGNLTQNELAGRITAITAVALIALLALARYLQRAPTPPASKEPSAVAPRSRGPQESSVVDVPHTLSGVIGHDAKKIDEAFDELSKNLSGLRGKAGEAFVEQVQKFYLDHQNNKHDPSYEKACELVQSNMQNYRFLLDMKGAIFLTKTYTIHEGKMDMPSDGNCLFHTLGAGLNLLEPEMTRRGMWNNFPFDHETIREKVNEWMVAHLETDAKLKEHIDNAIMEYCPILEEQQRRDRLSVEFDNRTIDDDVDYQEKERQIAVLRSVQYDSPGTLQAHQLYIEMTRGLGKFASSPQMYAFCQLNPHVGIVVAKDVFFPGRNGAPDRRGVSFDQFPPFNPDARFIIKPHFNESGDHFDLNISVDQRSLPDQLSLDRSVEK